MVWGNVEEAEMRWFWKDGELERCSLLMRVDMWWVESFGSWPRQGGYALMIIQAFVAALMSVHPTLEGSDTMVTRLVSVEATCCSGTAGFEVHVRN